MGTAKNNLIEEIIIDLDVNFSHSKEVLLNLAREALTEKTMRELLNFWEE